ncbi:MAG: hypothetical protein AAB503_02760 [Patescibacteria group bacterium]
MLLKFTIHDEFLLLHALVSSQPLPFPAWKLFKEGLQKKYQLAFHSFIDKDFLVFAVLWHGRLNEFDKKPRLSIQKLIKEALVSTEFKRLKQETIKYERFVKNQWRRNEDRALSELQSITGLDLPKRRITVYLTHPKLKNGVSLRHLNAICWGHRENWKNYTTVYLCHELLHLTTANREDLMHAIIELVCDNELRIRLNNGGTYFKIDGESIGHPELLRTEKKILPFWKKYLKRKDGNISHFEKTMEKFIVKKKARVCKRAFNR